MRATCLALNASGSVEGSRQVQLRHVGSGGKGGAYWGPQELVGQQTHMQENRDLGTILNIAVLRAGSLRT